jgi:hypothetical protein
MAQAAIGLWGRIQAAKELGMCLGGRSDGSAVDERFFSGHASRCQYEFCAGLPTQFGSAVNHSAKRCLDAQIKRLALLDLWMNRGHEYLHSIYLS